MSEQWQIRRGTTAENDGFTGAEGEITMDTDKKQLRVHDGSTQGGAGIIDPIVAFQVPTAGNNYTWYRKYKSGWVEQGGKSTSDGQTVVFPITMADTEYFLSGMAKEVDTGAISSVAYLDKTTASVKLYAKRVNANGFASGANPVYWEVKGMAA